jgi:hypothetical protein
MDNRQVQLSLVFSNGLYTRQFSKEENAAFADFLKWRALHFSFSIGSATFRDDGILFFTPVSFCYLPSDFCI